MPKVNVYLPDKLAESVRAAELPISAICQRALGDALRGIPDSGDQRTSALGVYGRFMGRARKALELALEEAERSRQPRIGTEHLLMGVLRQGDNLAVRIIEHLGLLPDTLMVDLAAQSEEGNEPPDHNSTLDQLLSSSARRAVELGASASVRFASGVGANAYVIGCEHILIGLLSLEQDVAADVLRRNGIELDEVLRAANMVQQDRLEADSGKVAAPQPLVSDARHGGIDQPSLRETLDDVVRRLHALELASSR